MNRRIIGISIAASGLAMLLVAIGWWTLLFPTVVQNTGLSLLEALPCIASDSSICRLETALCGGQHLFGIRHYSPQLFWLGALLASVAPLVRGLPRGTEARQAHEP